MLDGLARQVLLVVEDLDDALVLLHHLLDVGYILQGQLLQLLYVALLVQQK